MNRIEELYSKLQNSFFLAAIQENGDGAACAQRSRGCAMVQLGLYFADPPAYGHDTGPYGRFALPSDPRECDAFLATACQKVRSVSDAVLCVNLASLKLEWCLEAAHSFLLGGGEIIELNCHAGYTLYNEQGKLRAMILPQHQPELFRWVEGFTGQGLPLIVKFPGKNNRQELLKVLEILSGYPLFGVHINIRDEETKQPDLAFVRKIKRAYPHFLLASGYVRSMADAQALFDAGANMVGIGEPTMQDPLYISRLAYEFEGKGY